MPHSYRIELEGLYKQGGPHLRDSLPPTGAMELMILSLIESLEDHAGALKKAADASYKYARRLVVATWALVSSTIALVVVAIVQNIMRT